MREEVIKKISEEKVIAIVRGIESEKLLKVAEALYAGGIRLMEITFDQKNPDKFYQTADGIAAVAKAYKGKMLVGAGTVITPELVDMAADAGAKYIISPDANEAVIKRTLERGLVSIPGAMTSTEILFAHRCGADFVKLFPLGNLGSAYVKAIKAPISHVKLLAVGGVNEKNIAEFIASGVDGAGIGGNLVNKTWIENCEFEKITETAKEIVSAIKG